MRVPHLVRKRRFKIPRNLWALEGLQSLSVRGRRDGSGRGATCTKSPNPTPSHTFVVSLPSAYRLSEKGFPLVHVCNMTQKPLRRPLGRPCRSFSLSPRASMFSSKPTAILRRPCIDTSGTFHYYVYTHGATEFALIST